MELITAVESALLVLGIGFVIHEAYHAVRDTVGNAFGKPKPCQRCAEIRASKPENLVYFRDPSKPYDPEKERRDGEIIRTMALAEHAAAGHP